MAQIAHTQAAHNVIYTNAILQYLSALLVLLCLVTALLGIKVWWFKKRLSFEHETHDLATDNWRATQNRQTTTALNTLGATYRQYDEPITVHGVFRMREEHEIDNEIVKVKQLPPIREPKSLRKTSSFLRTLTRRTSQRGLDMQTRTIILPENPILLCKTEQTCAADNNYIDTTTTTTATTTTNLGNVATEHMEIEQLIRSHNNNNNNNNNNAHLSINTQNSGTTTATTIGMLTIVENEPEIMHARTLPGTSTHEERLSVLQRYSSLPRTFNNKNSTTTTTATNLIQTIFKRNSMPNEWQNNNNNNNNINVTLVESTDSGNSQQPAQLAINMLKVIDNDNQEACSHSSIDFGTDSDEFDAETVSVNMQMQTVEASRATTTTTTTKNSLESAGSVAFGKSIDEDWENFMQLTRRSSSSTIKTENQTVDEADEEQIRLMQQNMRKLSRAHLKVTFDPEEHYLPSASDEYSSSNDEAENMPVSKRLTKFDTERLMLPPPLPLTPPPAIDINYMDVENYADDSVLHVNLHPNIVETNADFYMHDYKKPTPQARTRQASVTDSSSSSNK